MKPWFSVFQKHRSSRHRRSSPAPLVASPGADSPVPCWRRIAGGLVAAVLLLPVPVFAAASLSTITWNAVSLSSNDTNSPTNPFSSGNGHSVGNGDTPPTIGDTLSLTLSSTASGNYIAGISTWSVTGNFSINGNMGDTLTLGGTLTGLSSLGVTVRPLIFNQLARWRLGHWRNGQRGLRRLDITVAADMSSPCSRV